MLMSSVGLSRFALPQRERGGLAPKSQWPTSGGSLRAGLGPRSHGTEGCLAAAAGDGLALAPVPISSPGPARPYSILDPRQRVEL